WRMAPQAEPATLTRAGSVGEGAGGTARLLRVLPPLVALLSLLFLSFLGGALVILSKVPPYETVRNAYLAAKAFHGKLTDYNDVYSTDLWRTARTDARGVTVYDPQKAYPGLTLYSSGHANEAYLVTLEGEIVHRWHLPFSQVWDESSPVRSPQPDSHTY